MRVIIAGSSGFIGTALCERLQRSGVELHRLVRSAPLASERTNEIFWQPGSPLDPAVLDGVDAVINLAGASIAKMPWTAKRKRNILDSRMAATATLVDALHANPGPALINASAVGFYGSRGDEPLTEASARGEGFLADVVAAWEDAALRASDVARVALVRTGLVIGDGGAIVPLRALTTAGLGGNLGGGRQWWPWISLHDEVAAIEFVLRSELDGPVNLAGPTPATMGEIGRGLARRMHRPYFAHVPAFALKLLLGDAGDELLLSSQQLVPGKLVDAGFAFTHQRAEQAIDALFA